MSDKRLTLRLTEYWDSLRQQAMLPQWERFDIGAFADVWRQCCGWRVDTGEGNTLVFTYDYVGESVKEAIGGDLAGQKFTAARLPGAPLATSRQMEKVFATHFHAFPVARVVKKADRAINKRIPVVEEGRFEDSDGKTVRYRSCLLPFGTAEGKVTRIMLGLSWKVYQE
jgi:hypothetical protein